MTTQEFDYQFDVLYNNIMSNAAPGLDSYEKSVFLTKAQDEIIKSYFNPKGNKYQEGFDGSPKRQYDFSSLIKTEYLREVSLLDKMHSSSKCFIFPDDYFLSLNEVVQENNKQYNVSPISYEEYSKQLSKPYKYPPKNSAWRLITKSNYNILGVSKTLQLGEDDRAVLELTYTGIENKAIYLRTATEDEVDEYGEGVFLASENEGIITIIIGPGEELGALLSTTSAKQYLEDVDLSITFSQEFYYLAPDSYNAFIGSVIFMVNNYIITPNNIIIEVIGKFNGSITYKLRYIKRPKPIILSNLEDTKIEGLSDKTECELPEGLHYEILQRAVELAKIAYIGDVNSSINIGQRSE